jgi:uncharacterized small protein (DUF1192 family)
MFFILTVSLAGQTAQLTGRSRGQAADMTSQGGWVKRLWRYYYASRVHGWNAHAAKGIRLCGKRSGKEIEMALEDEAPPPKRRRLEPLLLDSLGIEELRLYIEELKTEISRVEADIGRKHSHRSAADAFFKRP